MVLVLEDYNYKPEDHGICSSCHQWEEKEALRMCLKVVVRREIKLCAHHTCESPACSVHQSTL
jgi:hypothetical protein